LPSRAEQLHSGHQGVCLEEETHEGGSGVAVIGFGSPAVEVGDIYKVPLKASGKRSIMVNTVVVEAIYNGPPAKCPQNIT
jgi:hypothetical protein